MSGIPLDNADCLIQRIFTIQICIEFLVAKSLHCRGIFPDAPFFQITHFIEKPLLHHQIHPPVDPLIEPAAFICQHKIGIIIW